MDTGALVNVTQGYLAGAADADKAAPMAAYMKTDMPFYGVQKAGRTPILRTLTRQFSPTNRSEYEAAILTLWNLPHREEKYLAIGFARTFDDFIDIDSLPIYEDLISDGAWWDFVDEVATQLVGRALMKDRPDVEPIIRSWILDDDMWFRRTSIICQLKHKHDTDMRMLDDACTENLADTKFFIRKAIGWALREHAKADPQWVRAYVAEHRDKMSGLSTREATKHL
jgi:3-methyladenine DNA glycosylase AlkD